MPRTILDRLGQGWDILVLAAVYARIAALVCCCLVDEAGRAALRRPRASVAR